MPFTLEEILEDMVDAQALPLDRRDAWLGYGFCVSERLYSLTPEKRRAKRTVEQMRERWRLDAAKWRAANPERANAIARRWREQHLEAAARQRKAWRDKHLEYARAKERERYHANPEPRRQRNRRNARKRHERLRLRRAVLIALILHAATGAAS